MWQSPKVRGTSDDQTQYLAEINLAREACSSLHHVEVPQFRILCPFAIRNGVITT